MENIVKKAKEYCFLSQSVNASSAPELWGKVNSLLAQGWDILNSQSIGLDTGGGQSGGGNLMMVVSMVRYEYIRLLDTPADGPA